MVHNTIILWMLASTMNYVFYSRNLIVSFIFRLLSIVVLAVFLSDLNYVAFTLAMLLWMIFTQVALEYAKVKFYDSLACLFCESCDADDSGAMEIIQNL